MIIRVTSKFKKSFKRLPRNVKDNAEEKEKILRTNPFDSRLDTHKLHGKYKHYWAFTITGQYRIMFAFVKQDIIDFINVGTHKIYK